MVEVGHGHAFDFSSRIIDQQWEDWNSYHHMHFNGDREIGFANTSIHTNFHSPTNSITQGSKDEKD